MTIIVPNNKIRKIELTEDELSLLMDFIRARFSIDDYEFLKPIINKLDDKKKTNRGRKNEI